jgi:ribonuclease P protein component
LNHTYPKEEKLKSKKQIDLLFTEGKSLSKFPLRLMYVACDFEDEVPLKMGVSVSKKHFKKAVDRNYFKRVLRETFRLNKQKLTQHLTKKHCFMLLYQSKDRLTYKEINEKTIQLFEKFILTNKEKNEL